MAADLRPGPELGSGAPGCRPNPGCLAWSAGLAVAAVLAAIAGLFLLLGPDGPEPARIAGAESPSPPPASQPAAPASPAAEPDRWTVELADPAGGRPLLRSGGPELAYRQTRLGDVDLAVAELVGGSYEGSGDARTIEFYGGTLTRPLAAAELEQSAAGRLQAGFAVNFPNLTPVDDQVRQYDPGPLGGQLWCTSYQDGYYACGWLDEQTLGYVFVIGGSEAGTAELLVRLRADTEVR